MAPPMKKLYAVLGIAILFASFRHCVPTPTISASPAVLPYGNAPNNNMSSFFPTSPTSEAFAPVAVAVPSSGEFVGKVNSSADFNRGCALVAIYAAALSTLFVNLV